MSLSDTLQDDRQSARLQLRPVVIAVLAAKLTAAAILIANVSMPGHAQATAEILRTE
ncbi:hypothetical protein [Rhizobium sp. RU36D]|uniref:hypothetical protein n=1 Tax=Rhizobium sp. RU36D TaxID=1907415 RepID=UPI0009D7A4C1|nr:hypothetical protein [Rhizobium sp. RU36D]SMC61324.1 hypothetical protein SAMN05880593_103237 [Rhizobium sp. RU36D]